jgi:pseudouridine-5'-phosphate glycosidase
VTRIFVPADLLAVHPEVAEALAAGRAVVALESTIVTHGMPFPQNLETARAVESLVRAGGAVPATIAILDGRIAVGLADAELTRIAEAGPSAAKASRRDLAILLASRRLAGTTVATTMMAAAMAGVRVFATGGIGGVHRGAETSFDVSADLTELARTPVAVVCAGAKSILDLPKTLEVLETQGVPVIGYRTDAFPAFFARDSGARVPHRLDDAATIARAATLHWRLGGGGVLVANPIPAEDALPAAEIEAEIAAAVAEAARAGIAGKDVTPFLLARINALTAGRSLAANIALVRNNAALAAEIAVALAAS